MKIRSAGGMMRPRFVMEVSPPPAEALRRVAVWADDPECACGIMATDRQIDVLIPEQERHVWSPWMSIRVEALNPQRPEMGARLIGRFAPHPSIWTLFMSLYAVMAFTVVGGSMYALAQLTLKQTPYALWALPGAAVGAALVYLGSRVGQRLGGEQMQQLRHCVGQLFEDDPEADASEQARAGLAARPSPTPSDQVPQGLV